MFHVKQLNPISCPNQPHPQNDTPAQPSTRQTLNPSPPNPDTTISTPVWEPWSVCRGPRSARQEPMYSHACADSTKRPDAVSNQPHWSWPLLIQQNESFPTRHTTLHPAHRAWPTFQASCVLSSSCSSPRLSSWFSKDRSPSSGLFSESSSRSGVTSIVIGA